MAEIQHAETKNKMRRQHDQVRLESWKVIAHYLKRSVRTVRRWEANEGLPVHRHKHTKGFSVYAVESELDIWLSENLETLKSSSSDRQTDSQPRREIRFGIYATMLTFALILGVVGDRYLLGLKPASEAVALDSRRQFLPADYWPESAAQVLVAPVFSAWADSRVHDAYREAQSVQHNLSILPDEVRWIVIDYLVEFSLILGRIGDANELIRDLSDTKLRHELETRIAFASGDMMRLGDVLNSGLGANGRLPAQSDVTVAMALMQDGNMVEAKELLEGATRELVVEDRGYFFVAADILAGVLKSEGELPDAIVVLERTMHQRHSAARNRSGLFWLMCQHQLVKAYRESGRFEDAEHLERELQDFLILADETFPLARRATGV